MAVNLEGFSTPQQSYEGLFRLGDDLRQKNYAEEQRGYQRSQAQQGRKDANDKYFTNLLNPKDYLTGTHYDPNTIKLLQEATSQAYELSAQGADMNAITMAIGPLVSKVADYSSKAKMYQQSLKALNERMSKEKGWNVQRVNELLDDYTFYKVDPKTGEKVLDVDAADPSLKSAMERIDRENLHEVTTADGFNAWADKFPKMAQQATVGNPNKYGSQHTRKLGVTAANWEMPEEDDKGNISFVPKYEVATDNRVPLQHEFTQPDGSVVRAPIRLLDRTFFESILSDKDAARHLRARVQQEIRDYKDEAGNPIPLNSPKAELVARAVAYDMLKARAGGVVNQSDVRTQSPVETRVILTGAPYAPQRSAKEDDGEKLPMGNVLNTIQVYRGQKDGWYGMNTKGNKTNMAAIQQLLGENILSQDEIESQEIKYQVRNGQVEAVAVKGQIYRRGDFERLQKQLDKEPKWAGSLRYPTEQQRFDGALQGGAAPAKGGGKGKVMSKADWMKLPLSKRAELKAQGYTFQ